MVQLPVFPMTEASWRRDAPLSLKLSSHINISLFLAKAARCSTGASSHVTLTFVRETTADSGPEHGDDTGNQLGVETLPLG